MSSALVGCLVGAIALGPAEPTGSAASGCLIVPAACSSRSRRSAPRWRARSAMFVANRLVGGVAIGLASNLSPLYIAEVAPARDPGQARVGQPAHDRHRHPAGPGDQLADRRARGRRRVGRADPRFVERPVGWRWMFGVDGRPGALFFLAAMFSSPRARAGWRRPAARTGPADPHPDRRRGLCASRAGEIRQTLTRPSGRRQGGLREVLDPRRPPAVLCSASCWPSSSSGAGST